MNSSANQISPISFAAKPFRFAGQPIFQPAGFLRTSWKPVPDLPPPAANMPSSAALAQDGKLGIGARRHGLRLHP
jgi:hypothetical protein